MRCNYTGTLAAVITPHAHHLSFPSLQSIVTFTPPYHHVTTARPHHQLTLSFFTASLITHYWQREMANTTGRRSLPLLVGHGSSHVVIATVWSIGHWIIVATHATIITTTITLHCSIRHVRWSSALAGGIGHSCIWLVNGRYGRHGGRRLAQPLPLVITTRLNLLSLLLTSLLVFTGYYFAIHWLLLRY